MTSSWQSAMRRLPTADEAYRWQPGNGENSQVSPAPGSSLPAEDTAYATAPPARRARPRVCGSRLGEARGRPTIRRLPRRRRATGVRPGPRRQVLRRRRGQSVPFPRDRHRPRRPRVLARQDRRTRPRPGRLALGPRRKPTMSRTWSAASTFASSRWQGDDLDGLSDLEEVTSSLSLVADRVLAGAIRLAGADNGLSVIAMGKHGAKELNYSSDIDILLVAPDAGEVDPALARAVGRDRIAGVPHRHQPPSRGTLRRARAVRRLLRRLLGPVGPALGVPGTIEGSPLRWRRQHRQTVRKGSLGAPLVAAIRRRRPRRAAHDEGQGGGCRCQAGPRPP